MTELPPALVWALQLQLEHEPPFTAEEVVAVGSVTLRNGSERPYGIDQLPELCSVLFRGCGAVDIREDLGFRPKIFSFKAWASGVTDLSAAPELLPNLSVVEVCVGQLRDLRPLLALPKLRHLDLAGNPIDEHSFREVYPELVRRGKVLESRQEAVILEREWALMQRFVARGLKLSAYRVWGKTNVAAPGHTVYPRPEGMGEEIGPPQVLAILDEHADAPLDEATFLALAKERVRAEGYRE